jgi:DNA-directed RNA polymerase subunit omega
MNADFVQKALEKVGNANVLVNLISRRVRQLNSGGGSVSRPLIEPGNLGVVDIALLEIIEGKMGWTMPEIVDTPRPTKRTAKNKLQRAA